MNNLINCISIAESVYKPGSEAHLGLLKEARRLYDDGLLVLEDIDKTLFE